LKSKYLDEYIISSDSDEIIEEGKKFGLNCYFKRPKNISGDKIGDVPVLKHALIEVEKHNKVKYDIIIMLQPTAPLRNEVQINNVIKKIINEDLDTVWTVHKVDDKFHPDKQLKINSNGYLNYFTNKGKDIISRQQLGDSYMKNGIAYAITREFLLKKKLILGDKAGFIILDGPILNIDTYTELKEAVKYF